MVMCESDDVSVRCAYASDLGAEEDLLRLASPARLDARRPQEARGDRRQAPHQGPTHRHAAAGELGHEAREEALPHQTPRSDLKLPSKLTATWWEGTYRCLGAVEHPGHEVDAHGGLEEGVPRTARQGIAQCEGED